MNNGTIGQVKGPFSSSENIITTRLGSLSSDQTIKIGVTIGEKDWMQFGDKKKYPKGFYFILNNTEIEIGRTCIYETDEPLCVSNLQFPYGDKVASLIVDYVVY